MYQLSISAMHNVNLILSYGISWPSSSKKSSQIEKERKTLNITLLKSEAVILETLRNRKREEKARWRLKSYRMTYQSYIRDLSSKKY